MGEAMKTQIWEDGKLQQLPSFAAAIIRKIPAQAVQKSPLVLTFVGAGGKTTLLYALAEEFAAQGQKVLVMTTTHMYEPIQYGVFCDDVSVVADKLQRDHLAIAGRCDGRGKITFWGDRFYEQVCPYADVVLIEGDGAKGRPFKICSDTEPVIPANTDAVLAVAGLTAIGKTMAEVCFRYTLAGLLENSILTPKLLAELWRQYYLQPLAKRGYTVIPVLNQGDTDVLVETGKDIFKYLSISNGVITVCTHHDG
jgi:probable selenium-dependent hydroxylase accessory protein YqeC